MSHPLYPLLIGALLAVVAVLAIGIGGFARGGKFNRNHGNRLMRLRIAIQAIAIILILIIVGAQLGGLE